MKQKKGPNVNQSNFRPPTTFFNTREEAKGTMPLSDPISVQDALLGMVIHGCRKILFFNTKIKVAAYLGAIFFSFAFDYASLPRSYFSRSSNMFNQYFVKLGWMWTLILMIPFVLLTSLTYCCGDIKMVRRHLARLGVATSIWFVFTKFFVYYENSYGRCSVRSFTTKQTCLGGGHFWDSLDISGHAFILMFSSLLMVEEAQVIIGWESIHHFIREEAHHRSKSLDKLLSSPLRNLSYQQLVYLNNAYLRYTPYIKTLFIATTLLVCLWDVMFLSTVLYFHKMVEKLIGGILAVAAWLTTYHYWYSRTSLLPYAPRVGAFNYKPKTTLDKVSKRRSIPTGNALFGKFKSANGLSAQPFAEDDKSTCETFTTPSNATYGPVARDSTRLVAQSTRYDQ